MNFSEKLISLRKEEGYTQEQLAELLGVTRQAISRWESGETAPDISMLSKMCEVFHVSADYLVNNANQQKDSRTSNQEAQDPVNPNHDVVEIRSVNLFLVSAICFVIGAFFAVVGIITSKSSEQLSISCVCLVVFVAVAIIQFINYYKRK